MESGRGKESNPETNKENLELVFTSASLKRICSNRHSLHQKIEFKQSLNNQHTAKPAILSSLSNSVSSIPAIERTVYNEATLSATSSDGAMQTKRSKDLKDLSHLIQKDHLLLSPTSKNTLLISQQAAANFDQNQQRQAANVRPANYEPNKSGNSKNSMTVNTTATKRRASMADGSFVSPTKSECGHFALFTPLNLSNVFLLAREMLIDGPLDGL